MKTRILFPVVALVLALGSHTVRPATIVWTNSAGGNWNATANWSPNQVPVVADDAVITNSGTYTVTLNANATVASLTLGGTSGTQSFVINANTLTLNGASAVGSNGSLNLGGGTLGGAGTLTVNGPFNWSSGTVANTGGVTLNGTSTLSGVGLSAMRLTGRLINAGLMSWGGSGTNLYFQTGTLTNPAAGTIIVTADVATQNGGGVNSLGNAGLLRKTGGLGATTIGGNIPFVNTGNVQVQSGTLTVAGGGSATGTLEPSVNGTLQFSGTTYTLNSSTLTGAGTVLVSATLTLSGANTSGNNVALNLGGGTLGGAGTLTVNGPFNWSSGIINNTGGVTLNGASTLSGMGLSAMQLTGRLINTGLLSWGGSGNNLYFQNGTLTNLAAGTITITADVSTQNGGGVNSLGNAGLLRKTGGLGTTTIVGNIPFVNTGNVQVQSGTLTVAGGGSASGSFEPSANGTLQFSGTTYTLNSSTLTGTGTVLVSATLTLSGANASGNNVTLNLGGGTLGGAGTLTVNGSFNWSSGIINNTGGVTLNGASTLSGVGVLAMQLTGNGQLINAGQMTWSGSGTNFYFQAGTLTNLAAGTITITADVSPQNGGGVNTLGNAGLFRKTAGLGSTTIPLNIAFVNTGNVQVQSGMLTVAGGGSATGTFEPSAIGTLQFSGTAYTLNSSSLLGAGSVLVSATLTLSGANTTGNNIALNLGGGTLGGAGTLTVNGPFDWSSGTINNTGGVTLNGASTLSGVGVLAMQLTGNGRLINAGLLSWDGSGNNLYFQNGTLTNLAAGTITITADVSTQNGGGVNSFGNAGLMRKTGGLGTTTIAINIPFVNTGTLDVQTGTVSLNGAYNLTNGTFNFGISSPTSFGRINLAGAAGLTGTVSANLNNGYLPIGGYSFTVLTYGSRTGIFTNTVLPFADAWQTNYTTTNFTLVVLNARPLIFGGVISVDELTTLVTNVVTDLDTNAQTMVSSLVAAPEGMMIDGNTGVITWTPAQTQSPSTNTVTVVATDNGTPPLSATNSFTVIVVEVNVAPALPSIATQGVNVLALLTVTNTATEPNIHSATIGYALINPPAGMSISTNGLITWTPNLSQGPATNTITTVVTNYNPYDVITPNLTATNSFTVIVFALTLAPLGNFTVDAGQTVAFTASATHNDSTRTLAFSLGTAPASATINPVSGLFNWRPPVTSAGSSNHIQVIVTDNSVPPLSATQSFYVLVNALTPVTLTPLSKTTTQFQLQVTGPIGPDYVLQAKDALSSVAWVNLLTNTPVASPFSVTDTNVSAFPNRFYRIRLAP